MRIKMLKNKPTVVKVKYVIQKKIIMIQLLT
jgi:hypothetical protein